MSAPDPKSTIEALGWEVEYVTWTHSPFGPVPKDYRARQRNFTTPWRSTLAEVLEDVMKIKEPAKQ